MFCHEAFLKIQTSVAFLIFLFSDMLWAGCEQSGSWLAGNDAVFVIWVCRKLGGHAGVRSYSRHDASMLDSISWSAVCFLMLILLWRTCNPLSLDDLFEDAHAEPEADALRYFYALIFELKRRKDGSHYFERMLQQWPLGIQVASCLWGAHIA